MEYQELKKYVIDYNKSNLKKVNSSNLLKTMMDEALVVYKEASAWITDAIGYHAVVKLGNKFIKYDYWKYYNGRIDFYWDSLEEYAEKIVPTIQYEKKVS